MRLVVTLFLSLFLSMFQSLCFAQAPREIGGFALGADVSDYAQLVKTETTLPIRFLEFLEEVEIKRNEFFKSGYLAYGICATPGSVVRIKLKYADSSKDFFENLLARYKKRYGKPSEWLGDSFHVTLGWKWSFQENGDNIDLFLLHNTRDEEKKIGNSMKLTINNLIDSERQCFETKYPDFRKPVEVIESGNEKDWNKLMPN